ncbi:type III secretion system chaperone [Succinivibrio dextrinosolvens]|uniref:type III secretion system chaperone n=1 Tax=Succinivibrio dextrinosolvens TaxID=83771 RepID=UPI00241E2584|nr:type III secretion system chaperone [Succinivibrio dextrinosolvens]MBE6422429.1 type III secretion system chaperone [Succinivibrio dextrinosolvens]
MDIIHINNLLKQFKRVHLNDFLENGISTTRLNDGNELYANITDNSVMFFMSVEKLGDNAEDHPNVFSDLLAAAMAGGKFSNLRIVYDKETTIVWVCYDISIDHLTADRFEEGAECFIENAQPYIDYLRTVITSSFLDENSVTGVPQSNGNGMSNIHNFLSI